MDRKKGKLKQTMTRRTIQHRSMGILLAAIVVCNTLPIRGFTVSASEYASAVEEQPSIKDKETGLCEHHPEHTLECGYAELHECDYVCEICNSTEVKDTEDETEDGNGTEPKDVKDDTEDDSDTEPKSTEDDIEEIDTEETEREKPEDAANANDLAAVSTLYVLGKEVVSGSVTSGEGWSYDKTTNTLTLENLTVTADDYPTGVTKFLDLGVNANCLLNVFLKGTNTIDGVTEDEYIFCRSYLAMRITGEDGASLTLNGMVQNEFDLISGNIILTINTPGGISLNYGMSIDDGAKVVFNCRYKDTFAHFYSALSSPSGGISVKNNSTLEINAANNPLHQFNIYGYGPLTVEDSTLTIKSAHESGIAVYLRNPWNGNVGDNDIITIKNSTVNLDSVEGLRGYSIEIADSEISTSEKTALALMSMGGEVTVTDTTLNGLILESGMSNKFTVSGEANRPTNLTLAEGDTLTIPEGASLNIPEGVTLTNNGTMRIHDKTSLTGAGTLDGTGSFLIDVTEDLISIPEGLACTGTDYADQIKLAETITICGTEFTTDTSGWTRSISPSETVVGAGEYTVTFTKGDQSVSKTFNVAACPHTDLVYEPLEGGGHGGTCAVCNTEVSEEHNWKDGVCTVCNVEAVAKVEKDGAVITYAAEGDFVGTEGVLTNSAYEGATVTLLADVQPCSDSTSGRACSALADITCTLDLAGYKFTGNDVVIYILPAGNLTIQDSSLGKTGQVVSTNDTAIRVEGLSTLAGGTYISQNAGAVYATSGLCVTGEEVKIEGKTYGLYVQSSTGNYLSAGTYSGDPAIQAASPFLGSLFANTNEIYYAYFDSAGKSISLADLVGKTEMTGSVTVRKCAHKDVEADSNDDGTHDLECPYCGYTGAADCNYAFSGNVGTCQNCKSTLTVSVTGTENLIYNGTEKKPEVTVTLDVDGTTLDTSSYTVDYSNNINAGIASVTVTIGENHGKYTKIFSIGKAAPAVAWSGNAQTLTYTGKQAEAIPPTVTLVDGESFDKIIHYSYKKHGESTYKDGLPIDVGTYTIKAHIDADVNYTAADSTNELTLTINKADAAVTVGTDTYNKTYGDPAFALDVTDDNQEADVQYKVEEGTDVVSVTNGTATIQNAGKAVITASLPETANYNAAEGQTITINVAKKDGYTVSEIQKDYYFDKQGTEKINLAILLPADCGAVSYGTPTIAGDVTYHAAPVVSGGELSYTVDRGSADEKGTITVAVTTRNYADITVRVTITRSACDHVAGEEVLYTGEGEKAPTCIEDGLGHKECTKCGSVMELGITVPALGHDYKSEVTKEPTVSAEGERTYICSRCGDTYTEAIPRTTPEGLWVSGLEQSFPYTGSAIKPEGIRVYHGTTLLREKTEYTISYKNNTKAGTAQVIVNGKGSYKGKATAEFIIEAVDLRTDPNISAFIATATETGKNLKPKVTVTWNGKKLKEKTDYTLTYEANIKTASAEGHDVSISGKGNYAGTIVRKFRVVSRGTPLLNSAKVTGLAKSYVFDYGRQSDGQSEQDGNLEGRDVAPKGLESDLAEIIVKVGTATLTKDADYTVRTESTDAVGTGYVVIEPTQNSAYAGEKRIPVKIIGASLKKCYITGLQKTYPYTGKSVMPEIKVYTGKNETGTQIPSEAYTVRYSNYINQGKATITVTGIAAKGYIGSIKAVYHIGRLDLAAEESAGTITVTMPADIKYAKGGAKPQPVIIHSCDGAVRTLREGVDYTLKYSGNTAKYDNGISTGTKRPTLKITGIGNYCGIITKNFAIDAQDIGTLEITAADKAYNSRKKGSYYYSAPKVYDHDGKQLKSGKDYTIRYTNAATGQEIGKKDTIENGIEICVTVSATEKSSYTGTLSTTYFVRDAKDVKDIAKAKYDKIAPRQYTGSEIKPEVSLYTLAGKTKNYLSAEDYEIIGYYNNVKKGTATILIRGRNAYSGVKSITFKITAADNQSIWSGIF